MPLTDITKILKQYTSEVEEALEETKKIVAKDTAKDLKKTSPKKSGKYAKGWRVKKKKKSYIIYNKDRGPLTHLLERPHALKNGKKTKAFPHILIAREKAFKKIEEEFKRLLNG